MDAIRKAGQWGGAAIFYGNFAGWMWGLLTVPDRNVFVDMIGAVVSLHSLYLGAAVGSAILAIGCSWSGISWAVGVYRRWGENQRSKSPSSQFRRLSNGISREFALTELDEDVVNIGRSDALKYAQRETLRFSLSKFGVKTPDPSKVSDNMWYLFLTGLVPLSLDGRVEDAKILGAKFDNRKGTT